MIMTTWFTSDWHLWHDNIIKYSKRPFKNVEEMNDAIINTFYSKVKNGDILYFVGDFAFSNKSKIEKITETIRELTEYATIHFILGNHDYVLREVFEKYCASVSPLKVVKIDDHKISLCHFPMHSFSGSHHNQWHVYGHHHRNTNNEIAGKRYNVTLDANNYQIISFDELKQIMNSRGNNWDYISEEVIKERKTRKKLKKELLQINIRIKNTEKKMTKEFMEKAPVEIKEKFEKNIKSYKNRITEINALLERNE